jgi:hypothetical protein
MSQARFIGSLERQGLSSDPQFIGKGGQSVSVQGGSDLGPDDDVHD